MLSSKSTRWAIIALAIAVALGVMFYPTDEKRVRQAADAIVSAARADVSIDVAELAEPLRGRAAIVAAVAQASALGQNLRFRIEGVEVSIEGKRARLSADLITTLRAEVPELRRPRHSVALFEKQGDRFRLISAEIGAERLDQPEARP